uniref:Eukaryotic translation initiation factor 5 n=1 Tax=Panagrolaimus sp. PS1159 TaxID=55785 RepID=A0AC35GTE6_9BILA
MAFNVNRSAIDPYYRFKMPRLQAKVERKCNGIKTVIANLSDIAKALDRPPVYALKFLGPEVAASTKKLLNEAYRLELKSRAPFLMARLLFDTDILNQIGTYKTLLYHFLKDNPKGQRRFLGGIEELIEKNKNQLLSCSTNIIKKLYAENLVEKAVILEWGAKPSSKYINKSLAKEIISSCQPFLKRLQDGKEDASKGGPNDVVEVDERLLGITPGGQPNNDGIRGSVGNKAVEVEGDDDEINIDDI